MDVSPRFDVPANVRPQPSSSTSHTSVADPSVCEWAADLDRRFRFEVVDAIGTGSATSLSAAGFVDFDAIETIHVSGVAAS